ncbi:hypothetical protein PHLGIDRAFT_360943 [Phlebiopsis gigantea 11061_1 CR5-6]|uniref:DUSP domain-containing protein n=1 Tax=Phlebiopsis gigantea (strain 11061_1 CR5-6) TaxID=745531 RepID=A0A0C3PPE5_PHLG1|nr:hypothetical protein PHLGIDRAFT_360943 [Phlebiopsis gigantea 11061_1 CR5-6]
MLNPSPTNSPSLTSQDSNNSRKRLRSLSLESESSSSSPKRSMSQDPSLDAAHDTPRNNDLPTPPAENQAMSPDHDTQMNDPATMAPTPVSQTGAASASSSTLTPKEKYDKVAAFAQRDMIVGETWYVVSRRWYRRWEKACTGVMDKEGGVEEKDIGPVDNGYLVDLKGNLTASSLAEGVDVQFVPEEAWELLSEWYVLTSDIRLCRAWVAVA